MVVVSKNMIFKSQVQKPTLYKTSLKIYYYFGLAAGILFKWGLDGQKNVWFFVVRGIVEDYSKRASEIKVFLFRP